MTIKQNITVTNKWRLVSNCWHFIKVKTICLLLYKPNFFVDLLQMFYICLPALHCKPSFALMVWCDVDIYTPQLKAQRNWTCINVLHSPRESSLEAFNDVFLTSDRSSHAEVLSGRVMWSFPSGECFSSYDFFNHSRKTKAIWITDGDMSA